MTVLPLAGKIKIKASSGDIILAPLSCANLLSHLSDITYFLSFYLAFARIFSHSVLSPILSSPLSFRRTVKLKPFNSLKKERKESIPLSILEIIFSF